MSICEALETTGIAVCDEYLELRRVRELQKCLEERRARGEFSAARIGRDATLHRNAQVRGDRTCWLSEPLMGAENELLRDLEGLRLELNRRLYLGLFEPELHYAWYAPGAAYARHVDQLQGRGVARRVRRVSLILYLNENWGPQDGGGLELYEGEGLDACRRVEPLAGRLVCFVTEGREHAVRAAHRDRFSISGWFRSR